MSPVTSAMTASRSWELRAAVKRSMRSRTGSSACMPPSFQPLPGKRLEDTLGHDSCGAAVARPRLAQMGWPPDSLQHGAPLRTGRQRAGLHRAVEVYGGGGILTGLGSWRGRRMPAGETDL